MKTIDQDTLISRLNWRYAVKKFDSTKKISEKDWHVLEESLRLSPSSYGLQPWKFLIVQNSELRSQLTPATWNQTQVKDCSHYVVFTYKQKMDEEHIDKFIKKNAEIRGMTPDQLEGFKKVMIGDLVKGPRSEVIHWWAQRQCYIAMGFLMESAALLGIDACPIEGLDSKAYDKILSLENTGYETVVAVACGYRHADDKYQHVKKVRFDKNEVIEHLL